ncbi:MAG: hypothetical protein QM302_06590 [Acidobacteriota bacterium]|nr:hypothetical protein [Acidobacteriota bacterium]
MPAIITHHLFGEEAARRLPGEPSYDGEELLAFLLGNQGPNPYCFCFTATPATIQTAHRLSELMHADKEAEALLLARDAVSHLPVGDQAVGHAFVLGLLAHYLLDSEAHAFIVAQERAICDADAELEGAHDQVHALIESELDTWTLWSARHQTIADAPAQANLARTERIGRVAGTILSQVAWQAFGLTISPDRYEGCLRDCELIYRAIDPTGNPYGRMIAGAERLGARYSLLDALSHAAAPTEDCPAANLDCHPWHDPLTGEGRAASFADVLHDALGRWPALAEAFTRGEQEALRGLMRRGYDGTPLEPTPQEADEGVR